MVNKLEIDKYIKELQAHKNSWVNEVSIEQKIELLKEVRNNVINLADDWIQRDLQSRKVPRDSWDSPTSITFGALFPLKILRIYISALEDIQRFGKPRIPGQISTSISGNTIANVFPYEWSDKILYQGITASIWLEKGVDTLTQKLPPKSGKVTLVLGAGNAAMISVTDILNTLINENSVLLFKIHPVLDYLIDFIPKSFKPLIDLGYLQVIQGGVEEGEYLCKHPGVEEIHLTGGLTTYESIVYGTGDLGLENKRLNKPLFNKRVTAELGNISPVIIVPGPWSEEDIRYQAENLCVGTALNCGFNCNANKVYLQHLDSAHRSHLMDELQIALQTLPTGTAYYPGAESRIKELIKRYPQAALIGDSNDHKIPWTLIRDLHPSEQHELWDREIFGPVACELALPGETIENYLENVVHFCNEKLWGTLNATIIVHPQSMRDPTIRNAVEKTIADLHYGTVCLNIFPGVSYVLGTTPWGGYPGSSIRDIQSGTGFVNNPLMIDHIEKIVVRAPFKAWPKPPWFPTNKKGPKTTQNALEFEETQSILSLLKTVGSAI